jgi:hypothetical protein
MASVELTRAATTRELVNFHAQNCSQKLALSRLSKVVTIIRFLKFELK